MGDDTRKRKPRKNNPYIADPSNRDLDGMDPADDSLGGNDFPKHDSSYRRLFSHARMIEDLLRKFVAKPWIKKLHFHTLEEVKAHYTSATLEQRENDLVWRLRYGDDPADWLYVYLLLELQSTIPRFMAVRLLAYLALFYQSLIRKNRLTVTGKLPPVLPIVLYNGKRPWSAPIEVADLIEPIQGGLEEFVPNFRYLVLDETHYPLAQLEPIDNPVAAVFKLEQSRDLDELPSIVQTLLDIFDDRQLTSLRKDFTLWLRTIILRSPLDPEIRQRVLQINDLQEVKTMLEQNLLVEWPQQWKAEGRREGRAEGRKEGRREGRKEGESRILRLLLEAKFGPLGQRDRAKLAAASTTKLVRWAKRVLTAATLEEVFADG